MNPSLVWFRQDLRLQDNPALQAAIARGGAIVPLYVLEEGRGPGGAARWWLHHSLARLEEALRERGSRLILARGEPGDVIAKIVRELGAGAVFWNRRHEPDGLACDAQLEQELVARGIEVQSCNAALLHEPHEIAKRDGGPFQVFTPFWRHCGEQPVAPPIATTAKSLAAPARWPRSLPLGELELQPRIRWAAGLAATWEPGEAAALKRLRRFVAHGLERYADERDQPAVEGTSQLSPHLHFGELGPRQVWAAVRAVGRSRGVFPPHRGATVFLNEIGWREFAHHLLFHFPQTVAAPLRAAYARFPWAEDPGGKKLGAWQRGETGYPIVDAGMRQLWRTGWMHNRVRMIAASFLVKHLRLPWQRGAEWFLDTLVDADLANNTLGWQWSAGCGADAAPYFRIFSPVRQAEKFDPDAAYVKRWVPELAGVPAKFVHAPWEAPPEVLHAAGVSLGENYPRPLVEHGAARAAALAAFRSLREARFA